MNVVDTHGKKYSYKEVSAWSYSHWLCGSCGARFQDNPDAKLNHIHNGVKIIPGTKQAEADNKVFAIKHVKTRAGDITVGIRRKVKK